MDVPSSQTRTGIFPRGLYFDTPEFGSAGGAITYSYGMPFSSNTMRTFHTYGLRGVPSSFIDALQIRSGKIGSPRRPIEIANGRHLAAPQNTKAPRMQRPLTYVNV